MKHRSSRCSRAANSAVLGPIWPNLELVRDVIGGLVSSKYEGDPIKNEGARVLTTLPHYNPMGAICCHGNPSKDLPQNRWTDLQETWYVGSGTPVHYSLFK